VSKMARQKYSHLTLQGRFCVLCPLHQERYEEWCWLCGRVLARKYGWNARPLPWWAEPDPGERIIRPVQREIDTLRN
jgi:predicted amidophosphoribosyltransferase